MRQKGRQEKRVSPEEAGRRGCRNVFPKCGEVHDYAYVAWVAFLGEEDEMWRSKSRGGGS